jgi:hypothetical protein
MGGLPPVARFGAVVGAIASHSGASASIRRPRVVGLCACTVTTRRLRVVRLDARTATTPRPRVHGWRPARLSPCGPR